MGSRTPAQLWSPSSAQGVTPLPHPGWKRRPPALLSPGRPSAGRPQLRDSANPTQINPGVGSSLGFVGMPLGRDLSFALCPAQLENNRVGSCLKVKEVTWFGGCGWSEMWFSEPSAGKIYAPPYPSLFPLYLHSTALGGGSGDLLNLAPDPLLQEVYPELSRSHQTLLPLHSFFSEAFLYAGSQARHWSCWHGSNPVR